MLTSAAGRQCPGTDMLGPCHVSGLEAIEGYKIENLTKTFVPLRSETISKVPLNWRTRSSMPRTPTPALAASSPAVFRENTFAAVTDLNSR